MKFKNYILSLVLVFTNILVNAQELFSPAGTSVSTSTVVFEYAIGDIIVGSTDNSNFQITQGFLQPRSSSATVFGQAPLTRTGTILETGRLEFLIIQTIL